MKKMKLFLFTPIMYFRLQSLTSENLQEDEVDLVVTNYSRYVSDDVIETKYLLLKEVPDDQDWHQLEKMIDPYRKKLF